jgi:ribosomal protein L29
MKQYTLDYFRKMSDTQLNHELNEWYQSYECNKRIGHKACELADLNKVNKIKKVIAERI